jgi:hypothetical protein
MSWISREIAKVNIQLYDGRSSKLDLGYFLVSRSNLWDFQAIILRNNLPDRIERGELRSGRRWGVKRFCKHTFWPTQTPGLAPLEVVLVTPVSTSFTHGNYRGFSEEVVQKMSRPQRQLTLTSYYSKWSACLPVRFTLPHGSFPEFSFHWKEILAGSRLRRAIAPRFLPPFTRWGPGVPTGTTLSSKLLFNMTNLCVWSKCLATTTRKFPEQIQLFFLSFPYNQFTCRPISCWF